MTFNAGIGSVAGRVTVDAWKRFTVVFFDTRVNKEIGDPACRVRMASVAIAGRMTAWPCVTAGTIPCDRGMIHRRRCPARGGMTLAADGTVVTRVLYRMTT